MLYQKELIAARLASERKRNGYTQEELAETNIASKPTIVNWEKSDGKNRIPTLEQLLELCELYDCEVGYILGEYDTRTRAATDIFAETGLTEETVTKLQKSKDWGEQSLARFLNFFVPRCNIIMSTLTESIRTLTKDTFNQKYGNYDTIEQIYSEASRKSWESFFQAVSFDGHDSKAVLFFAMLYYFLTMHNGKLPESITEDDFFKFYTDIFALDGIHYSFDNVPESYKLRYSNLYNELKCASERAKKEREYIINDVFLDIVKEYVKTENMNYNEEYCKMLDNQ